MKRNLSLILAIITWFAIITEYILFMEIRIVSALELSIRFLSYFTIQTHLMVAILLSYRVLKPKEPSNNLLNKAGTLTALTVYITVVGAVYQIMLRPVWDPQGMFRIADELLHSIIPLAFIAYWYRFEDHTKVQWRQFSYWLIFPFIYLIYTLIHGYLSGYYPYPFVNVSEIGLQKVLLNSLALLFIFTFLSLAYIFIGKRSIKEN
ncbi:Pr6Pr family membrane protein [Daejeonella sp. H1SJ63]|uniref:Pr6Pr family membrane protein n=1 Tax=Daejeonella sp. H1SJ63 TaxID=3034145 RepID=UPI0023EB20B6|nr:Pr6Pr family membrane protein [Daejeonella sp. H1SJ63]